MANLGPISKADLGLVSKGEHPQRSKYQPL